MLRQGDRRSPTCSGNNKTLPIFFQKLTHPSRGRQYLHVAAAEMYFGARRHLVIMPCREIQVSCHYQHIDPQLLLKTVDGNAHVCAQLMTTFIETAPAIFARLMDAMKEGNAEWVWHESHALKGMAMLIGAQSFSDALQAMEKQAREKIVDNTQQNLLSLEAGFEKVLEEVGSYVQSLSATHPPSEK